MADETVNQESQQQTASDATTVNNGGSGTQQQGSEQNDPKWLDARLARAKEQARKEFLAELELDDPSEAKALLKDAKAKRDAELTESQRLAKELEKLKAKAEAAEQKAAQIEAARIQDKVDGAIRTAATAARAIDPNDVVEWLHKNAADDIAKVVDEDGKVDETAIKKMMERTRKERAHYFQSSGPGSPSNRGGSNPDPTKIENKSGKPLFKL